MLVLATCKDNSERDIIVTEQLIRGEQKKVIEGGGRRGQLRRKNSIDAYLSHVKKHTSQFTRCM